MTEPTPMSIYFNVSYANGGTLSDAPLKARYDEDIRSWVDGTRGIVIEYLGLILGAEIIFSSECKADVEKWMIEQGEHDSKQTKRRTT